MSFPTEALTQFLDTWGYWAVLVFIMIECLGIPFPGETMLLIAAVYAGTTHHLAIAGVIAASSLGAALGGQIGYWAGREGGYRLLDRYGKYVLLDKRKLKLGEILFANHGTKVVFFGRFLAILRAWAAFLAGCNRMDLRAFAIYNAAGAVLWSTIFGLLGYFLGKNKDQLQRIVTGLGTAGVIIAAVIILGAIVFWIRNGSAIEERLLEREVRQAAAREKVASRS
jgi:membrane protein DedA with SNARE-associated domain